MIGLMVADKSPGDAPTNWMDGSYLGSFVAASILLQSSIIAAILFCVCGLRKRDWPGLCLLPLFALVLLMFQYCFLDKVKGCVLWPWISG